MPSITAGGMHTHGEVSRSTVQDAAAMASRTRMVSSRRRACRILLRLILGRGRSRRSRGMHSQGSGGLSALGRPRAPRAGAAGDDGAAGDAGPTGTRAEQSRQ